MGIGNPDIIHGHSHPFMAASRSAPFKWGPYLVSKWIHIQF